MTSEADNLDTVPPLATVRDATQSAGLYRRFAQNLVMLIGGTGATALFSMGAVALNARALTPRDFGLLALLQTFALTLRGAFQIGTQQPIIHLGAEALADGDRERMGRIMGLSLVIDSAAAFLAFIIGLALLFLAGDLIHISGTDRHYGIIFVAAILGMGYMTASGLFRLSNRFGLMSLIQTGVAALVFALSIVLAFLKAPFDSYVWVWAISLALNAQLQLWASIFLMREAGCRLRFDFGELIAKDVERFRAYCWSTWGTATLDSFRTNGDSLIVAWMVGVEGVGIYNVAKQTAGILRKLTDNYASALFPEVAKIAARGAIKQARTLLWQVAATSAGIGAVSVLGALFLGKPLLHLAFGAHFATGYGVLVILIIAASLQLIAHTLAVYLQAFVSPGPLFWIYLAALAAYGLAVTIGLHFLGITGAAIGQICFSAVVIFLTWRLVARALAVHGGREAVLS